MTSEDLPDGESIDWDRPLSPEEQSQLHRSSRRIRVVAVASSAVMTLLFLLILGLAHRQHPGRPLRPLIIVAVFIGLTWGTTIAALVARKRTRRAGYRQVVLGRDTKTTRRVSKRLRRGEQIAPEDRELAAAIVAGTRATRFVVYFMLAFAGLELVLTVVNVFLPHHDQNYGRQLVVQTVTLVLVAAAASFVWRSYRRVMAAAKRQDLLPPGSFSAGGARIN